MKALGVCLFVGCVALAGAGRAQGFPDLGYMAMTIGAGGLQTSAMNNVIATAVKPSRARGDANASARPLAPPQAVTTYRANPLVAARVQKQFTDWMAKQAGAQGGQAVAAALRRDDPVASWSRLIAADGLRPGDTADALTAYWVLNWVIANRGDSTRAQVLAVRDQVRPTLARDPAHARLGEADRQAFAEVLILNFLIQHAAYVEALKRNDSQLLDRLSDAAVARFRNEMGVDLRRLRLTAEGFVSA